MPSLKDYAITRLSTTSGVDMKTAGSTTLFTVPAGKTALVLFIVIRNWSASLAGGTHYDFTDWVQGWSFNSLTTPSTKFYVLESNADSTGVTALTAGTNFQITVVTGSTAAATATIDVLGILV